MKKLYHFHIAVHGDGELLLAAVVLGEQVCKSKQIADSKWHNFRTKATTDIERGRFAMGFLAMLEKSPGPMLVKFAEIVEEFLEINWIWSTIAETLTYKNQIF